MFEARQAVRDCKVDFGGICIPVFKIERNWTTQTLDVNQCFETRVNEAYDAGEDTRLAAAGEPFVADRRQLAAMSITRCLRRYHCIMKEERKRKNMRDLDTKHRGRAAAGVGTSMLTIFQTEGPIAQMGQQLMVIPEKGMMALSTFVAQQKIETQQLVGKCAETQKIEIRTCTNAQKAKRTDMRQAMDQEINDLIDSFDYSREAHDCRANTKLKTLQRKNLQKLQKLRSRESLSKALQEGDEKVRQLAAEQRDQLIELLETQDEKYHEVEEEHDQEINKIKNEQKDVLASLKAELNAETAQKIRVARWNHAAKAAAKASMVCVSVCVCVCVCV